VRIRDGLPWVASNTDGTFPAAFGVAPGHGVQVEMLRRFTGVDPQVAGKPERPLLDETVRRVGGRRPLMVGDRLDTDIEGANAAGLDSLLVLTGVTDAHALLAADVRQRPTYVSAGLDALLAAMPEAVVDDDGNARCGGAEVGRDADGRLDLVTDGDPIDVLRAACAAAWHTPGTVGLTGRLTTSIGVFERR
jgi:glycerol 3-phosphatase-2